MEMTALLLAAHWAGWPVAGLMPLALAPLVVVAYTLRWLGCYWVPEL